MSSITFKLPEGLREKLEAQAAQERRTLSDFIRVEFEKKYGIAPAPVRSRIARPHAVKSRRQLARAS